LSCLGHVQLKEHIVYHLIYSQSAVCGVNSWKQSNCNCN